MFEYVIMMSQTHQRLGLILTEQETKSYLGLISMSRGLAFILSIYIPSFKLFTELVLVKVKQEQQSIHYFSVCLYHRANSERPATMFI